MVSRCALVDFLTGFNTGEVTKRVVIAPANKGNHSRSWLRSGLFSLKTRYNHWRKRMENGK